MTGNRRIVRFDNVLKIFDVSMSQKSSRLPTNPRMAEMTTTTIYKPSFYFSDNRSTANHEEE